MASLLSFTLQSNPKWPPPLWPPPIDQAWNFIGIVPWVGKYIFHLQKAVQFIPGNDSVFEYLQQFCTLVIATLCAAIWSVLDRKRPHYRRLFDWLTLFLQVALASQMFGYGFDKIFPNQFGTLSQSKILQPVGNFSTSDLLWTFMAASRGYTVFGGLMETLGGVLLLIPRFRRIGALVCIAVMTNVVALNLAYDIGVKLLSIELLLMSIFLAAPEFPRLARLLVWNSAAPPLRASTLSDRKWIDSGARILQIVLGVFLFCASFYGEWKFDSQTKAAAVGTVPFRGVWLVSEITVSGDPGHGLFSEKTVGPLHLAPGDDRWTRLVFERPNELIVQSLNGFLFGLTLVLDNGNATAQLKETDDPAWTGTLKIQQPSADLLNLQGKVNGQDVSIKLHRVSDSTFVLTNGEYRLIRD